MNERISRSAVELTPEREAIIRARTKIRPDKPGTNPGDPGNGHVLVIDEKHQKFNGKIYHRKGNDGYYVSQKVIDGKSKNEFLHVAVWTFHNGDKPKGCVVHHNQKDENGQWDKSCNNIESLLLVTPSEHRLYHVKYEPSFELQCEECHQTFIARSLDTKYCPKCNVEFLGEVTGLTKFLAVIKTQSTECNPANMRTKVIRRCFFCNRPFETDINSMEVACGRSDCQGKKYVTAIENARTDVLKKLTESGEGFFRFSSACFQSAIRCVFIDNEVWFIADDVCKILGCKNSDEVFVGYSNEETVRNHKLNSSVGISEVGIINRTGLHSLALKLKKVGRFEDWFDNVVVPAIQQYTRYFFDDEAAPILSLSDGTTLEFVDADCDPFTFSENDPVLQYRIWI